MGPAIDLNFPSDDNAASLYIDGGLSNVITYTKFRDHKGNQDYYTKNVADKFGKYFPTTYFQHAHAPVVRIKVYPLYNEI